MKKGLFDGFVFVIWLKDYFVLCVFDLLLENLVMVICDGCYVYIVDEVFEICVVMGIFMVILLFYCMYIL